MSRYFLCDYCEHAKQLDMFNADCDKYGVTAKRIISEDQYPCEVCDCYVQSIWLMVDAHAERLNGDA